MTEPENDSSYLDAAMRRTVRTWALMWLEMVDNGLPGEVATELLREYIGSIVMKTSPLEESQ